MNNIFKNLPDNLTEEVLENLASSSQVKIERIISKGHSSPSFGWYDQDQNEWVIVLKGQAEITFENDSTVLLSAGDYVNIKAHQKHKVKGADENSLVLQELSGQGC